MTLTTALMSCTALGLQHGVDWDHVAAISDVTSIQPTPREATRCGLLYAVGHAATVATLGLAVIVLRPSCNSGFGHPLRSHRGGAGLLQHQVVNARSTRSHFQRQRFHSLSACRDALQRPQCLDDRHSADASGK